MLISLLLYLFLIHHLTPFLLSGSLYLLVFTRRLITSLPHAPGELLRRMEMTAVG